MSIFNPDFYTRNPKLGFQFKVEFDLNIPDTDLKSVEWSGKDQYINRVLSTCVDGVTIPSIKIKSNPYVASRMYNSYIYDYSDMVLTINFSENDDMIVNKFLMMLSSVSRGNVKIENKNQKMYEFIPNSYMRVYNKDKDLPINFVTIKVFEMDIGKSSNNNYKSSLVHVFENCYLLNQENIAMEYIEKPKGVTMKIDFGFMRYYIQKPSPETHNTSMEKVITNFINEEQKRELEFLKELKSMPYSLNIEDGKKLIEKIYERLKGKNRNNKGMDDFYYGNKYSLEEMYKAAAYFGEVFVNVDNTITKAEEDFGTDYVLSMNDFSSIIHKKGNVTGFIYNGEKYIFDNENDRNIIEIAKKLEAKYIRPEDFKKNGKIIYVTGKNESELTYDEFVNKESHDSGHKMDAQYKVGEDDRKLKTEKVFDILKNDAFILKNCASLQLNENDSDGNPNSYENKIGYVLKAYKNQLNILINLKDEEYEVYNDLLTIHKRVSMYDNDDVKFNKSGSITKNKINKGMYELSKSKDYENEGYMLAGWIDYGQTGAIQYDIINKHKNDWLQLRFFRNQANNTKNTFSIFNKNDKFFKSAEEFKQWKKKTKQLIKGLK